MRVDGALSRSRSFNAPALAGPAGKGPGTFHVKNMKRPIRILYLAPCWPGGQSFGLQVRASQVAGALQL
jgi:hypothetical protein